MLTEGMRFFDMRSIKKGRRLSALVNETVWSLNLYPTGFVALARMATTSICLCNKLIIISLWLICFPSFGSYAEWSGIFYLNCIIAMSINSALMSEKNKESAEIASSSMFDAEKERIKRGIYRSDMEKLKLFTQMLKRNALFKKARVIHK